MFFITDNAVETLLLPERSRLPKSRVDFVRRSEFSTLENLLQRIRRGLERSHNSMDVIWHYDVASQFVFLIVEVPQCASHDVPKIRSLEMATAHALI